MPILRTIFPRKTSTSQTIANDVMVSLFESSIVTSISFNSAHEISLVFFAKWSLRLMIGEPRINRWSHCRRAHRVIYHRNKEILNGLAYQRPDKKHCSDYIPLLDHIYISFQPTVHICWIRMTCLICISPTLNCFLT